jgi:hypothetical protein
MGTGGSLLMLPPQLVGTENYPDRQRNQSDTKRADLPVMPTTEKEKIPPQH